MTEIKDTENHKTLEPIKDESQAIENKSQDHETAPVELYNSKVAEEQQNKIDEQNEYFQSVQTAFLERIKFLKKKLETKRQKEMKNMKFIGESGKQRDPFKAMFDKHVGKKPSLKIKAKR